MKQAVIFIVLAVGGYMGWKHYRAAKAAEPEAPPAANAPAPVSNQHGENRVTTFSGAAPE